MLLEFFNELKNNFMAVCQIRNVESIAMLEFWSWMLHLLSLNGKNQVSFLLGVKYKFFLGFTFLNQWIICF